MDRDSARRGDGRPRPPHAPVDRAALGRRSVGARERGVAVTCDVTPHHLAMTDAWVAGSRRFAWEEPDSGPDLAYDGLCRVNPPLASREDALALLAGLGDGIVDAIATDQRPHSAERKLVPFDDAAPGSIGLETALSLGLAAVESGRLELGALVAALSARPARSSVRRARLASGRQRSWCSSILTRAGASSARRWHRPRRTPRCSGWSCRASCA